MLKMVIPGQTRDMRLSSTLECLNVHRTAGGSESGQTALAFPAKTSKPVTYKQNENRRYAINK